MQEAATRRVPLYMIASNKTIVALATDTPTSESKLKLITGIGPKMIERYRGELLDIIREHLGIMEIPDERDEKLKLFLQQRGIVLSEADIKTLKSVINGE